MTEEEAWESHLREIRRAGASFGGLAYRGSDPEVVEARMILSGQDIDDPMVILEYIERKKEKEVNYGDAEQEKESGAGSAGRGDRGSRGATGQSSAAYRRAELIAGDTRETARRKDVPQWGTARWDFDDGDSDSRPT